MRNKDCFHQGLFNYDPISSQIFRIREELNDMDDFDLINEVYILGFHDRRGDDIVIDFYSDETLSKDDREYLINLYINIKSSIGIHVDELGQ